MEKRGGRDGVKTGRDGAGRERKGKERGRKMEGRREMDLFILEYLHRHILRLDSIDILVVYTVLHRNT